MNEVVVRHKVSHPHIWKYCKNHYGDRSGGPQREMEGFRMVVAQYSGCRLDQIRIADVLVVLGGAAEEAIRFCYENSPRTVFYELSEEHKNMVMMQHWNALNEVPSDPTYNIAYYLMRVYRNIIMMATMSNIEPLPPTDENLLTELRNLKHG